MNSRPDSSVSVPLPASLRPFFQDVDFDSLDVERNAATIIERTLSEGNTQEIRWLFAQYGVDRIAAWAKRRGAQRLPRHRHALWSVLLKVELPPAKDSLWNR